MKRQRIGRSLNGTDPKRSKTTRVRYQNVVANMHEHHLQEGMAILRAQSDADRAETVARVVRELANFQRRSRSGEAVSEEEIQNAADDIGIWWASERLAGRGDQHVVPDDLEGVKPTWLSPTEGSVH